MISPANENAPRVAAPEALNETEASIFRTYANSPHAAPQPPFVVNVFAPGPDETPAASCVPRREAQTCSFAELVETLKIAARENVAKAKGSAGYFILCSLRPATDETLGDKAQGHRERAKRLGYRDNQHVELIYGLAADYDVNPEKAPDLDPSRWPCRTVLYGSHNYDPRAAPGKLRALFAPFSRPVTLSEFERLRVALQWRVPGAVISSRAAHQPVFLPTCPEGKAVPFWEIPGADSLDVDALLAEAPELSERTQVDVAPSCVQLHARDGEVAQGLADLWQDGTTGERAYGAAAGWLRDLGVAEARALGILDEVSRLTRAVGGHAERRVRQAYAGGPTGGFSTLVEALGQNAGGKLGNTRGMPAASAGVLDVLNHPMVVVASELLVLEGLLRDSVSPEVALQELEARKADALAADDDAALRAVVREELEVKAKIEQTKPAAPPAPAKRGIAADAFATMSAEEFDAAETEIPWVIEKLVAQGEPTLLVAPAEGGKTSAVVSMALSVATGRPVWGRFHVAKAGPVVHIDYEQGRSLKRTYREFGQGLGVDVGALIRNGMLRLATLPRAQLLDPLATDAYLQEVSAHLMQLCAGASLCIVNSLTASTNQVSENDPKVARMFNLLTWVAEKTGCAFFVIHHSGRGENVRARGSSAIDGAVQSIFCCEKPPQADTDIDTDVLEGHTVWWQDKDRIGTGKLPEFRLDWRRMKSAGNQTLTASDPTKQTDGALPSGAERPVDRVCLAILRELDKGTSARKAINETLMESDALIKVAWKWLLSRRVVEHIGGRYKIASGVEVPTLCHQPIRLDGVPVERLSEAEAEKLKPASKSPEYRREARRKGRAA